MAPLLRDDPTVCGLPLERDSVTPSPHMQSDNLGDLSIVVAVKPLRHLQHQGHGFRQRETVGVSADGDYAERVPDEELHHVGVDNPLVYSQVTLVAAQETKVPPEPPPSANPDHPANARAPEPYPGLRRFAGSSLPHLPRSSLA